LDSDAAYPALFRTRLAGLFPMAMINVVNAGLGGENVIGALGRLERDVLSHRPALVTICLGLNDARGGKETVGEFESNLQALVEAVQAHSDVVLFTPNTRGDALQDNGTLADYVRSIRAVARKTGAGLADVNAIYQGAIRMGATPQDLLSNRVSHPTREGHTIFVNALMAFFQPGR
jgi:acyl-CoA thioesterase I